jgi:hypothetical protein
MSDPRTRRLVRKLFQALQRALPAVREADRAYRALLKATTDKPQRREAGRV